MYCAIKDIRILCLYFYDKNLIGRGYVGILQNVVQVALHNLPINEGASAWYQQDGAPPYNSRIVSALLENTFHGRWIANSGPYRCPALSPDMRPLDFFIWGFVKDCCYSNPVQVDKQERI